MFVNGNLFSRWVAAFLNGSLFSCWDVAFLHITNICVKFNQLISYVVLCVVV
jgi:hypothetical protein